MKTIVLTGMMGSGKTATGKLLASELNLSFYDIDTIIEQNENCSISEIFEKKGEDYFRKIEQLMIKNILIPENQIISLGGGAFENAETRELLLDKTTVIYLKTSAEIIYERIKNDTTRPLLKNNLTVERINDLIQIREKNYTLAKCVVLTDNKTLEQVAAEITECVN